MAMKFDGRLILVAIGVLVILSMQQTIPKEAVADIEGQSCTVDEDCPCWGTYNASTSLSGDAATAYGIGVGRCTNNACDMNLCLDVQPVGEWLNDNPWNWLKTNPLATVVIVVIIVGLIMWPKA